MTFKIGQKVVCVRGCISRKGDILKEGDIYTVLAILDCECGQNLNVGLGATPHGTICRYCLGQVSCVEWYLSATRFRPLIESWVEEVLEQAILEPVEI